jgi:hypothetical protein
MVNRSGNEQDIGVHGIADIDDAKAFHIVDRGQAGQDFNIAAVATAAIKVQHPWGLD